MKTQKHIKPSHEIEIEEKEEVKEFADGKNEHDKIFGHEYFVIEFMQSFYGKF